MKLIEDEKVKYDMRNFSSNLSVTGFSRLPKIKPSSVDMGYVYGTMFLADEEYPLDYPSQRDNPMYEYLCKRSCLAAI